MNENLKKILAVLLIAFMVVLTLRYIKMLPAVMKIAALAVDVITIYWAYTVIKTKTNKKEEDELED
jgi:heme O synthase-like polyprenyltransferase